MKMQFKPLYWLLYLLYLLPDVLLVLLARLFAAIAWYTHSDMRRITELNLQHCFADKTNKERQKLAKASLLETAKVAFEMPKVWLQSGEKSLKKVVKVSGEEHLKQLQSEGNGVLIIAPHLGNWEYLGHYLATHYSSMYMYKPSKSAVLNHIVISGRTKTGAQLAPTDKKGVLMVLKHLKQGGVTGILPDQAPDDPASRVSANFYSKPAPTMTLVSSLAKKPNIKAVAAFAKRLSCGNFEIIIKPAPNELYSDDIETSATALNAAVESIIAEAPAQYQWEYKRFKYDEHGNKHALYKKP